MSSPPSAAKTSHHLCIGACTRSGRKLTIFRTEGSELVKGSMLALTIDAILDFAGPRIGHFRMIECEISSHDAYGTPRNLFIAFFGVIAGVLRELLGADWSPEIDAAWRQMLEEIEAMVSQCTT